jgi:hypothetical protein
MLIIFFFECKNIILSTFYNEVRKVGFSSTTPKVGFAPLFQKVD